MFAHTGADDVPDNSLTSRSRPGPTHDLEHDAWP